MLKKLSSDPSCYPHQVLSSDLSSGPLWHSSCECVYGRRVIHSQKHTCPCRLLPPIPPPNQRVGPSWVDTTILYGHGDPRNMVALVGPTQCAMFKPPTRTPSQTTEQKPIWGKMPDQVVILVKLHLLEIPSRVTSGIRAPCVVCLAGLKYSVCVSGIRQYIRTFRIFAISCSFCTTFHANSR